MTYVKSTGLRLLLVAGLALLAAWAATPPSLAQAPGDSAPPSIQTDLAPGDTLPGPAVVLTGTATDNHAVARVRVAVRDTATGLWLQDDQQSWGDFHRFDTDLSHPGDTTTTWTRTLHLPDGDYLLSTRVTDQAGLETSIQPWQPFTARDDDGPSIRIGFGRGATVGGPDVILNGTAGDPSGVAAVRVAVRDTATGLWLGPDRVSWVPEEARIAAAIDGAGLATTWAVPVALPPGDYELSVGAADVAGNQGPPVSDHGFSVTDDEFVILAAGDVARCNSDGDSRTAALLDASLKEGVRGVVAVLGDAVYPDGTPEEFAECYHPTWGRHKDVTRPALGNHELHTPDAAGYFGYFGDAAGEPGRAYYAYEHGPWRVVVLDSNCSKTGGCDVTSTQMEWLQDELDSHSNRCTLAYMHHPRYSSGYHGDTEAISQLWRVLHEGGADLVLAGHDHHYERLAPADAEGAHPNGVRSFVVGTGGGPRHELTDDPGVLTEARLGGEHGVLRLTLDETSYGWEFLIAGGGASPDSGTAACR